MPKNLTKTRNRTEKKRTIKNKKERFYLFKSKKNCYRLKNPWHDVLIYNLKNGEKVSQSQKKSMRSIIKEQKEKGKNCFKAADSNEIFYFSNIEKLLN
jgi:hypothetical protein